MMHYSEMMKPTIHRLAETNSTNTYLREWVSREELPEFTVIMADFQASGRGQRGNFWESERGKNLLFSFLLYPDFVSAKSQFLISQIASLCIKEGLGRFASGFSIKWPNDIYWNEHKICGMLIENDLSGRMLSQSVLGIGVNINQDTFTSSAPNPISLKNITGRTWDREDILADMLRRFEAYYEFLRKGNAHIIAQKYFDSLFHKEGFHRYADKNGTFSAAIVEVKPAGELILCTEEGEKRGYLFKEIQYLLE